MGRSIGTTGKCVRCSAFVRFLYASAAVLISLSAAGEGPDGSRADRPSAAEVREALDRAVRFFVTKVATHGGYLWSYSADLSRRAGEGRATRTQIWVQPPGTPSVGMALLDAYKATGDRYYLDAATSAALALVWGQLECGGWDYKIDFHPSAERKWFYYHSKGKVDGSRLRNVGTFDDNNSQSALRFLIAVDKVTSDSKIHAAVERAIAFFLKAQFPNGAWPQRYPLARSGYTRYYTFNDNAINDCIYAMWDAWESYGRKDCRESALRGGRFIVLSQLKPPQAGWAQQYDHDLRPAPARWFEPAACCAAVTARNIRTLLDLYLWTGDGTFLKPIPAAIDWLERSAVRPGVWARFYELGTNRPIYYTADRKLVYKKMNLRPGYGWEGNFGVQVEIARYREIVKMGRERYLRSKRAPMGKRERERRLRYLARQVRAIISSLDEQGRWIVNGEIRTDVFIRNVGAMAEYLRLLADGGNK